MHNSKTSWIRPITLLTALLAGPAAGAGLARGEILPAGWAFRRTLTFKQARSDAPGDNLCWTEFYANGAQRPDASDIRVTTADGVIVPMKLMLASPDNDLIRIAFATHGDGPYEVWWGKPKPANAPPELQIQRGIYVEAFHRVPGETRDVPGLRALFQRAQSAGAGAGAAFVQTIFQGWNPLGEQVGEMLHYHGLFKIDAAVPTDFAFTVTNAGLLSIDGTPIDHDARGGLRARVRDPRPVDLTPGWHTIDVLQVNEGAINTAAAVVWKRGPERGYSPMSPSVFPPVAVAAAGPLEKIGAPYVADFSITPAAELFIPPDSFVPRLVFEANIPATFAPKISWTFGDGQKSVGARSLSHYFLSPGVYPVTLTVQEGANTFTTTKRILVRDRLYEDFPKPPQDSPQTALPWLRDEDVAALSPAQALKGMLLFKDQADPALTEAWGQAWLKGADTPPDKLLADETFDLTRALEARRDYAGIAEDFRLASLKPVGMDARLDLMRGQVMALCDDLDDPAAAAKVVADWRTRINEADGSQLRALASAALYAAIAGADQKAARAALAAAQKAAVTPYADAQIQQGVLARNVENYIRTKDYDTALKLLNQWELDYPDALWDGFTRTLRVKLLAAEKEPLIAARIAVQYAKARPDSFYAAQLLYRASLNFKAAGDPTQSKAALDLLTTHYPESPYARGAPAE